ncbi:hypothetical protein SDJN03_00770, partial [Cucurbita argyrosperma subsp. sororia]
MARIAVLHKNGSRRRRDPEDYLALTSKNDKNSAVVHKNGSRTRRDLEDYLALTSKNDKNSGSSQEEQPYKEGFGRLPCVNKQE